MRACIVEDDSTSRAMLEALLRKWGYETQVEEDGARAWETLRRADAPRLVLLDRAMPAMDGLEISRRLKALAFPLPPYIIMVTSMGGRESAVEALNAGADDYVAKPFEPEALRTRIGAGKRILELQSDLLEARDALNRAKAEGSYKEKNLRILIAEDDSTSRDLLVSLLEKRGHEVLPTSNGIEAWEAIQRPDAPRMVILDRLMPGMDGAELCRRIRTAGTAPPPYVIMLTIKGEKADIVSGLEAGADDYLSKPYDLGELYARIDVGGRMLGLQSALDLRIRTLRESEERIQDLLAEKELLLHEVHHRMKNNMHTIVGFLELQADAVRDPAAAAALMDARSRVLSMGILYDKLYRSKSVGELSIREFLPQLIDDIVDQFPNRNSVKVEKNIDDFVLDAQMLTTIGMIVAELVTNAMKHAFSGREGGSIRASASSKGGRATISLEDDGIGVPASIDCMNSEGFGLRLVANLTQQAGGTLFVERNNGTKFILAFDAAR
jgi:DNA-binding response OmpR family regulator